MSDFNYPFAALHGRQRRRAGFFFSGELTFIEGFLGALAPAGFLVVSAGALPLTAIGEGPRIARRGGVDDGPAPLLAVPGKGKDA